MAKKTSIHPPSVGFTDTKRVKDLIALMTDNGLSEIELVEDKSRILLRRGVASSVAQVAAPAPVASYTPPVVQAPDPGAKHAAEDHLVPIKSLMVGTFYSAPSPDAAAYVTIGSHVDEKTVVCIIEAMKVFNPITADTRGTIAKVLISNGQVVEYGQPLFLVKPE